MLSCRKPGVSVSVSVGVTLLSWLLRFISQFFVDSLVFQFQFQLVSQQFQFQFQFQFQVFQFQFQFVSLKNPASRFGVWTPAVQLGLAGYLNTRLKKYVLKYI